MKAMKAMKAMKEMKAGKWATSSNVSPSTALNLLTLIWARHGEARSIRSVSIDVR